MIWLVLACVAGILIHRRIVRGIEAHRAAVAACADEGHRHGEVFDALDNPHWPTRRCGRCGHTDHLSRCPCGNIVRREPPYEIIGCDTQNERRAG